jgi:hypothetical protein
MTSAKHKFNWLKIKRFREPNLPTMRKSWQRPPPSTLSRASLSWVLKLAQLQMIGTRRAQQGQAEEYKKNTFHQHEQKKDEAWKKELPKDGEKQEKQVGKYTYRDCEHHMVWTAHKPANCMLGKQHKEEQNKKPQKTCTLPCSWPLWPTWMNDSACQHDALLACMAGPNNTG